MTERQPSPHPAAKDLTHEDPAPMDAKLDGYPWLPRMIDKARAAEAGTLGSYYRYPCPIDGACLDLLGIDPGAFREVATRAHDDEYLVDALARMGADFEQLAHFDPMRLNAELHDASS
jgi:hypothetical protein